MASHRITRSTKRKEEEEEKEHEESTSESFSPRLWIEVVSGSPSSINTSSPSGRQAEETSVKSQET